MTTSNVEEFKLAVVGGGGVGKSALTVQFVQNVFVEECKNAPFYLLTFEKTIPLSRIPIANIVELMMFLASLRYLIPLYKSLRDSYMRNADGFVMVFSIIDRKTFEEINEFYDQILRVKDADKWPMVIIGNKCDLESERAVSKEDAMKLAASCGRMPYLEASAKARKNVDEVFYELVREVRKQKKPKDTADKPAKKKGCLVL
ncbi:Ras-related protein Rap [Acrasis kona]|uniref:Ras-related protein Rap n=1 Tax=Acrasis kona TaxID=1008807 RepID=A0AAW2ZH25_9EUKA